jgi:hypothetical protein
MTLSANSPIPPAGAFSGFRLVVKARASGRKGYIWEIVREDPHPQPVVDRSPGSYTTMEAAYTHGSVALAQVRSHGAPASPDDSSQ